MVHNIPQTTESVLKCDQLLLFLFVSPTSGVGPPECRPRPLH